MGSVLARHRAGLGGAVPVTLVGGERTGPRPPAWPLFARATPAWRPVREARTKRSPSPGRAGDHPPIAPRSTGTIVDWCSSVLACGPAAAMPPPLDDPGTTLRLMVVSTGDRHCGGIDLASGALVRAWTACPVDQRLRPYDVVDVTVAVTRIWCRTRPSPTRSSSPGRPLCRAAEGAAGAASDPATAPPRAGAIARYVWGDGALLGTEPRPPVCSAGEAQAHSSSRAKRAGFGATSCGAGARRCSPAGPPPGGLAAPGHARP